MGRVLVLLIGACFLTAGAVALFGLSTVSQAAPIATALIALSAAVIAYSALWWNRRIARLKATLDFIEGTESKEYYQRRYAAFREFRKSTPDKAAVADLSNADTQQLRSLCYDFLNHYEIVAIACETGVIDEEFYRRWMAPTLLRDWHEAAPLILAVRQPQNASSPGNPSAFCEFEALARKWGGRRLPRS